MNFFDFSILSKKEGFSFNLLPEEIHIWLANTEFNNSQKTLRYLLSHYLAVPPDSLIFDKTTRGKPLLLGFPEICFSIAHSGDLLAVALSLSPVGIDLEKKRKVNSLGIAQKFFSPTENSFLKTTNPQERFFQLWTAKEAALKADGRGITEGLRQAHCQIEEDSFSSLKLDQHSWAITPFFLKTTISKDQDHFIGAVASFSPPALIRWYDLRSAVSLVH